MIPDLLPRTRELRLNNGWGARRIGPALGISRQAAERLLKKVELAEARQNLPVVEIEPRTASEYADRITSCWRKSVEAIFEVGRLLIRAKEALPHGDFEAMIANSLPFGERTAERLMAISRDQRLTKATHGSLLPPSWRTLYDLTRLKDDEFAARIADGTIRADMERRDIAAAVKSERRDQREADLADKIFALPDKRYGVILADPEWRFEPYSRETGMDRAPENHYSTSATETIAARPIFEIAADDCVLFLWATAPMLPHALAVMNVWGFEYKSHVVWQKERMATGYWFRNEHELLLVGTRGHVPAPVMGTQWGSVRLSPKGRHSEKPDWQYELIEAYFPHLPKIELNARRARAGWDSWGAEAAEPEIGDNP